MMIFFSSFTRYLELLKLRFGEAQLHQCEVSAQMGCAGRGVSGDGFCPGQGGQGIEVGMVRLAWMEPGRPLLCMLYTLNPLSFPEQTDFFVTLSC